ncbi:hypothetical protein [Pigmentiphaga humi]|uniref:hypothetical protein n=1 Tax=Pigmentiphaga humi TaxID=2478468 RepID=UPI000F54433A|nr:hypothetical protein [Pigmentiphaga humi]
MTDFACSYSGHAFIQNVSVEIKIRESIESLFPINGQEKPGYLIVSLTKNKTVRATRAAMQTRENDTGW